MDEVGAPGIWFCQDTDMGRFMQGFRRRRGRAVWYRVQEGVESSTTSGELLAARVGLRSQIRSRLGLHGPRRIASWAALG